MYETDLAILTLHPMPGNFNAKHAEGDNDPVCVAFAERGMEAKG